MKNYKPKWAFPVLIISLLLTGTANAACGDVTRFNINGTIAVCNSLFCSSTGVGVGDPVTGIMEVTASAALPNSTFTQTDIPFIQLAVGSVSADGTGADIGSASFTTDVAGEITSGSILYSGLADTTVGTIPFTVTIDASTQTFDVSTSFLGLGSVVSGPFTFIRDPDTDGDGQQNFCDDDDDNDTLVDLDEADIGTDPLNPDTDSDGIGDALDTLPLPTDPPNNLCTIGGDDATMGAPVVDDLTCAARSSIELNDQASVGGPPAHLRLISPEVRIQSGFNVLEDGKLSITSTDPCPACSTD